MAKKPNPQTEPEENTEVPFDDTQPEGTIDPFNALGALYFNVDDEYKVEPLIPKGTYHAAATKISFTPAQNAITWDFCLHDNGGVMNDGETPIDGAHSYFRNWLPKPGDENIPTTSGKTNKRQSKINQLKQFSTELSLNMSTPAAIAEALVNQEWIGTEADVEIDITEYQGRFRNEITRVRKSKL